jgi:hypothetical protein
MDFVETLGRVRANRSGCSIRCNSGEVSLRVAAVSIGIPQNGKVVHYGLESKLPAVTVVEIDDLAVAGAGLELLNLDAVQLESTRHPVRRIVVHLDDGAVVFHSTNVPLRTERANANAHPSAATRRRGEREDRRRAVQGVQARTRAVRREGLPLGSFRTLSGFERKSSSRSQRST